MIPRSKNFRGLFDGWFNDENDINLYIEGCEKAPGWLASDQDGRLHAFRDELALHIRESSYPPTDEETQWTTDEWLRDIWYDVFGPDGPPGDPYPIPAEDWGRVRLTAYMLHAVSNEPEARSDGSPAWLEHRGLTAEQVVNVAIDVVVNFRPEPDDYLDHLANLTERGLRKPQPGEA